MSNFSAISARTSYIRWDAIDVCFVLDQHASLDFHVASTLKQQSAGRHVSPLGYWIHYPDSEQTSLSPYCYLLSGETINTNFIVFGLTRPGLEPQSTVFKASTLTITQRWGFHCKETLTTASSSCLKLK
jgi:hypothetical protein